MGGVLQLEPHAHHLSDDDGAGLSGALGSGAVRDLLECPHPRLRPGRRGGDEHGGRRVAPPAADDETAGNLAPRREPHQHDDRRALWGHALEQGRPGLLRVPRHGHYGGGRAAMRDRNARQGGRRHRRTDAGHHLERHAGGIERERLFAAAAEHERVAGLQANDAPPAARGADHQPVDGVLRHRAAASPLADGESLCVRRQREHLG